MKKETLKFPQSFTLKIIVENVLSHHENKDNIERLLLGEKIIGKKWSTKSSKEGKYISYSVSIMVNDKAQMDRVYSNIKALPHIKYAI